MLLLHLGIPPSGHGYAPPIAVAKITVLAKKGLYSAELHLRVYYSYRRRLSKKLSVNGEKNSTGLSTGAEKTRYLSGALPRNRPPLSRRRNGAANMKQHISLFLPSLKLRFQKTVVASRPSNSTLLHFPRFPEYFFTKRKRRKDSLNIRGVGFITSFSCRACRVSDDVSPCRESRFRCSCRRCGQSGRGCLLSNIRLPE